MTAQTSSGKSCLQSLVATAAGSGGGSAPDSGGRSRTPSRQQSFKELDPHLFLDAIVEVGTDKLCMTDGCSDMQVPRAESKLLTVWLLVLCVFLLLSRCTTAYTVLIICANIHIYVYISNYTLLFMAWDVQCYAAMPEPAETVSLYLGLREKTKKHLIV